MKLNEGGDVVLGFLFAIAIVILGFGIVGLVESFHQESVFNNWVAACESHGGYVKNTAQINADTEWDDCIVHNKVYIVPGYESYQKDKPANLDN